MTLGSFLSIPDADAFTVETGDGVVLPVYAIGGTDTAPGLLVGHANGLAAGSYAPWLRELTADARVFAFDARGHGGSRWPKEPLDVVFHVDRFAEDLALVTKAVAARLDGAPLHYAGHSLSAAAALRLATFGSPLPWASTTLFEPPIFPPPESPCFDEASEKQAPLITRSAMRRKEWPSPEAFYEVLRARGVFKRFRPDLLAAHCRATLRPSASHGYTLCCLPEIESAIFRHHRTADTWRRLSLVGDVIHLVSGDPEPPEHDWVSIAMPYIAAELRHADLTVLPDTGHMMIFERPDLCRDLVLKAVRATL